jgi:hypothetical protein
MISWLFLFIEAGWHPIDATAYSIRVYADMVTAAHQNAPLE